MTLLTLPQERALQQSGLTARGRLPCGCVLLEDDTVIYPHGERTTLAQHDAWLAEVQQNQSNQSKSRGGSHG